MANAENFNTKEEIDIVTCMFAFHEMPLKGQLRVKKCGKDCKRVL